MTWSRKKRPEAVRRIRRDLSDEEVIEVFRLRRQGLFQQDIANTLGLKSHVTVSNILRRKSYSTVAVPEELVL